MSRYERRTLGWETGITFPLPKRNQAKIPQMHTQFFNPLAVGVAHLGLILQVNLMSIQPTTDKELVNPLTTRIGHLLNRHHFT